MYSFKQNVFITIFLSLENISLTRKHVARLSLATLGPLARVYQRGSLVAPKHVA